MRHQTPETYGTELVTIRRGLLLTQAAFAACLGIRSDSLSRYERGKRHVPEPTIRLARQLAKGLQGQEYSKVPDFLTDICGLEPAR